MKPLNKEIVFYLAKKLNKNPNTIKKDISLLKGSYGSCTSNAVAHIYAQLHNKSILRYLDAEDKSSLPNIQVNNTIVIQKKKIKKQETIRTFFNYTTSDYFINEHIKEVNLAYTKGCLTCANILMRKIIENLIIDILRNKYPSQSLDHKKLYFDIERGKYLDFSVVLKNLYLKRTNFTNDDKVIIERLYQLSRRFKDDANDKVHSLFHIIKSRAEFDELDIATVIELIKKLESSLGMRKL